MIESVILFIKRFFLWTIYDPRHIWYCLIILVIAIFTIWIFEATADSIRFTGMTLQIFGILTIIWGIIKTRKFFGLKPIMDSFSDWWDRNPFKKRSHVGMGNISGTVSISGSGSGYSMTPLDPNDPIVVALEKIYKNIKQIKKEHADLQIDVKSKHELVLKLIKEEAKRNKIDIDDISKHIERFGTSSLHISAIGAVWLFFGVIFATISQELNILLKYYF